MMTEETATPPSRGAGHRGAVPFAAVQRRRWYGRLCTRCDPQCRPPCDPGRSPVSPDPAQRSIPRRGLRSTGPVSSPKRCKPQQSPAAPCKHLHHSHRPSSRWRSDSSRWDAAIVHYSVEISPTPSYIRAGASASWAATALCSLKATLASTRPRRQHLHDPRT